MLGFLCALIAGAAMSIQGVMNTRLGDKVGVLETNALVQGVGHAKLNLIVGILDGVVARIGFSLLLGHFMGLTGFWLGSGLAGFVTTIIMGIYYHTGRWQNRQLVTE